MEPFPAGRRTQRRPAFFFDPQPCVVSDKYKSARRQVTGSLTIHLTTTPHAGIRFELDHSPVFTKKPLNRKQANQRKEIGPRIRYGVS